MEIKKCTKCGETKSVNDFYKNSKSKDGLKTWCKVCHLADSKKREKNYNEKRRLYRLEHKEEYRQKKKVYYIENKDKILSDNSQWRKTFNGRLLSYQRSAKKRNIEWLLTEDDFKTFWGVPCNYCGDEIETIGIDRIDNEKPYILENCTSCCSTCNKMKLDLTHEKFINKIKQILNNLKK